MRPAAVGGVLLGPTVDEAELKPRVVAAWATEAPT